MKIRVLGCYGGEGPGHRTTCLLVNDTLLVDAGAITQALTLEEQTRINAALISHTHLDHLKDIAFLADNVIGRRNAPVEIISIPSAIRSIRTHFLNDRLWPDFTAIPTRKSPVLKLKEIQAGRPYKVEGITVRAIPVHHTVDAVGFILDDGAGSIVFSGDTGPTAQLWREANKLKHLKAIFVETSFPNSMQGIADASCHLSPRTLEGELQKLSHNGVPVFVYHMKPNFLADLTREIRDLGRKEVVFLKQGDLLQF